MIYGPKQPFSAELHAQKYRAPGESFEAAMTRVAKALADHALHLDAFLDALLDMRFMPAGRVQSAMGSPRGVTPYNCFVSGTVEDSFVDGPGSIMSRATEAAQTMRMGGGIGYDFSTLRPRGDIIQKLQSQSSGPLSFMRIFDAVCKCVASSGHRRGAQMGVLRVDHPDVEEFISAKTNSTELTGFNLSLGVTDRFMEAVALGRPFDLTFNGEVRKTVDAQDLWERIMRTTWDWAEPGVLFVDAINRLNNLHYCETIVATNPCGEQPLPPYGACLLGSFNLVRYVKRGAEGHLYFDVVQFREDIPAVVRAMDNVVDRATYPLPQQRAEAHSKRRMGLGVTGLANAAEALGFPYGTHLFLDFERAVLETLRDEAYVASALIARDKGAFPLYSESHYLKGAFIRTLPEEVREIIQENGIRNSHLTSIAPTGTISLCADNVSSSIEPVFSYGFDRTVQTFDGPRVERVSDYGYQVFGVRGKQSRDVTAQQHVDVLCVAAKLVDSAVSKTCNVSPDMPWEDFKAIYVRAWEGGAKGCTTFNSGGKRFGVLVAPSAEDRQLSLELPEPAAAEPDAPSCTVDFATGRRSCE